MKIIENMDNKINISFLDILYAAVLSFGLNSISNIDSGLKGFTFIFVCVIIIADWKYVHKAYWGWEYKYSIFLIVDLLILLVISKLFYESAIDPKNNFWNWLFILSIIYAFWDIISYAGK